MLNKKVFLLLFTLQNIAIALVYQNLVNRDNSIVWQTAEILADHQAQIKKLDKPFI